MAITASSAHAAPMPAPGIGCTLTQDAPGGSFRLTGEGFPSGESVAILDSEGIVVSRYTVPPSGDIEILYRPYDNYTIVSDAARVSCAVVYAPDR
ncbi:hypothetical protein [Streptomyces sp. NPDC057580]|uniref:hypothetical protein n=1 Tax=Streptomyces sp. NPDC057580 TaxID=3346173 RepID=UPI00368787BD